MMRFLRFFLAYQAVSRIVWTTDDIIQGYSVKAFLPESKTYNRQGMRTFHSSSGLSTMTARSTVGPSENRVASIRRYATTKEDNGATSNSKSEPIGLFVEQLAESFQKNTFVSLTLRGAKKKKGKKDDADDLRGSIRLVQGRLIMVSSKIKNKNDKNDNGNKTILLQMTIKYHGATDICKNFELDAVPQAIHDLFLGDPAEIASEWGVQAVRAKPIQSAQLTTTNQVLDLRLGKKASLKKEAVADDSATIAPVAESHDRTKQVPLSNHAEFFKRLGVTNTDGKPKPRMKGKLRQCQKFVEIVGRIIDESQKTKQKKISVVDMGCGRAYLTFSLHAYLQEHYKSITTTGIDVRPKLVAEISGIARSLGSDFDSLNFEAGTIEEVVAQASATRQQVKDEDTLSVLVALHACDTATDDALYSAIAQNSDIIVVAPCCHKQVRPQLNAHFSSTREVHPFSSILKHGVYRERISETVTDSLRALLLEYAGYKVQVFEFIGGEHTSKNVMITAIKDRRSNTESIRQQILSLAALHGISSQKLAQMMEFDLSPGKHVQSQESLMVKRGNSTQLSKNRMPPVRS